MPIYQYKCTGCGKPEEIMKSAKDYDRKEYCVHCTSELTREIAKPAPPKFVGSGFYATDYGRKTK